MADRLIIALILLCAWAGAVSATDLAGYRNLFEEHTWKIEAEYRSGLEEIHKDYLRFLEARIAVAKERGNLDAYKQFAAEKKRFQTEGTVPAESEFGDLTSKADARKTSAMLELAGQYLSALNRLKVSLMRADRIEKAEEVEEGIVEIEKRIKGLENMAELLDAKLRLPAELRRGMAVWYDFNRDRQKTVVDLSGNGNDGVVRGAKWVADARGARNGAYEFDGRDDSIDIGRPEAFDFGRDAFAVAAWFKTRSNNNQYRKIMDNCIHPRSGFFIGLCRNGKSNWANRLLWTSKHPRNQEFVSRRSVNDGKWHFMVVTRTSPKELKMYIDGTLSSRLAIDATTNISPERNTAIGVRFPGMIDDVMIWRRALSETEVAELCRASQH